MASIYENIKNALSLFCSPGIFNNSPPQYKDKNYPYGSAAAGKYIQEVGRYASDCYDIEIQGLSDGDWEDYITVMARMSPTSNINATVSTVINDMMTVLLLNPKYTYIPRGAKVRAMGSVWIATNPMSISLPSNGTSVIERCNAVWRYYDYYLNVREEPIIYERGYLSAVSDQTGGAVLLENGSQKICYQLNDATRQLKNNSRLILGGGAYVIKGVNDFTQSFTGDYDSVRYAECYIYVDEVQPLDDMENYVANGLLSDWTVAVAGDLTAGVGGKSQLYASSSKNGEAVEGTEEYPISYLWESSDPAVAVVDENGVVTGIAEGEAEITCRLKQNPGKMCAVLFSVTEAQSGAKPQFLTPVAESLGAMQSAEIFAAVFLDGAQTADVVTWTFGGARPDSYSADVQGNSAVITCWGYSKEPLVIKIEFGGSEKTAQIRLLPV